MRTAMLPSLAAHQLLVWALICSPPCPAIIAWWGHRQAKQGVWNKGMKAGIWPFPFGRLSPWYLCTILTTEQYSCTLHFASQQPPSTTSLTPTAMSTSSTEPAEPPIVTVTLDGVTAKRAIVHELHQMGLQNTISWTIPFPHADQGPIEEEVTVDCHTGDDSQPFKLHQRFTIHREDATQDNVEKYHGSGATIDKVFADKITKPDRGTLQKRLETYKHCLKASAEPLSQWYRSVPSSPTPAWTSLYAHSNFPLESLYPPTTPNDPCAQSKRYTQLCTDKTTFDIQPIRDSSTHSNADRYRDVNWPESIPTHQIAIPAVDYRQGRFLNVNGTRQFIVLTFERPYFTRDGSLSRASTLVNR